MARRANKTKRDAPAPAADAVVQQPSRRLIVANGVAALFMFLSWLGQNIYQSEADSARLDIEREVQFSNGEMTKVITWTQMFQTEIRKENPDPEIILNAASHHARTVGAIIETGTQIDPDSKVLSKHLNEFKELDQPLQSAIENRTQSRAPDAVKESTSKIASLSQRLMTWFEMVGPDAQAAVQQRYESVRKNAETGKWVFWSAYIVGSLIFAVTWYFAYFTKGAKQKAA